MRIIIVNRQKKIPISSRAIKKIILRIFNILKTNFAGQLTVVFTDSRSIQELNFRFLGKHRPTDVLCFDLSDNQGFAADIVISTEQACENSRLFKSSPQREIRLYLIHGILHLLGFSDYKKRDRDRMQRKALEVLKRL